jgi:excisionase family DNA binding protein
VADPTTWLTLRGAAQHTQLSPATLLRAVKRGELIAFRVGGRRLIRFRAHDLDGWLEEQVVVS